MIEKNARTVLWAIPWIGGVVSVLLFSSDKNNPVVAVVILVIASVSTLIFNALLDRWYFKIRN